MNLITYREDNNDNTKELILEKATKTQDVWMIVRLSDYYPSVLLFTSEKQARERYIELTTALYNANAPFLFAKVELATEYVGDSNANLTESLSLGDISQCNVEWYI